MVPMILPSLLLSAARSTPADGHMCPECGNPAHPFCGWCLGTGLVSVLQLQAWQRRKWAEAGAEIGGLRSTAGGG
jgi:hypothetical protein